MSSMIEKMEDLRSIKNPKARIKILRGHFVTSHSHLNTYIDMSTVKTRHNNARETAKVLAQEYINSTYVNTIVCLDETEVVGTFLAEQLSDSSTLSLSAGNNISVITPEYNAMGQIMFRDNKQRMIRNQQVLVMAASVTTGRTISRAIESILYYGGTVCGVCAIFSAVSKVAGMEIKTIFAGRDVPDYRAFDQISCPMCQAGEKIDAIVNSFGYSTLE